MARTYIFFLVIAGILASLVPSSKTPAPSVGQPAFAGQPAASRDTGTAHGATVDPNSSTIDLQREDNGHFYAEVAINGSPVRVLVDTGASGIALSRSDAQRAGLAVSAGMFEVIGEGADGDVHGEYVTLDRVSLGSK